MPNSSWKGVKKCMHPNMIILFTISNNIVNTTTTTKNNNTNNNKIVGICYVFIVLQLPFYDLHLIFLFSSFFRIYFD